MAISKKRFKKIDDIEIFREDEEEGTFEEEAPISYKSNFKLDKEDDHIPDNDEIAMFAGLNSVDEVLYDDIEYQEDLENLHHTQLK